MSDFWEIALLVAVAASAIVGGVEARLLSSETPEPRGMVLSSFGIGAAYLLEYNREAPV